MGLAAGLSSKGEMPMSVRQEKQLLGSMDMGALCPACPGFISSPSGRK
jgi:hypothetical protein